MRNVQEIKPDVKLRSGGVKTKIEEEAKMVKDLEQKAKSKCFIGFCPSIKSRYRLSKKPEEGASASVGLIRQCQFTGPKDTEDEPGKDFEAFESRQKVFNDIMEAMKDTSINMIGVYGMSGVGKSTLLKEVVRKVRKFKLFDWVVMVAVTENPVIVTIQDQIAESLGLKLEAENERGRAGELRQSLEEKRVLFVLDDLGAKLDFEKVGISSGNEENRCKMLLASRDQDVLLQSDGMHALNTFPINHLDEQEATDLFKRIIGESNISPELQTERNEIPKRCGGLPLPISTVALALKNKDQLDWTDALRQLQSPSRGLKDISPALYSAIELCYNHIERKELQQFFLFCSLLSHDFLIEILLRYTIGLGLLSGDYTVEEARNRLLTWVGNLKAAGLLLDSYSNERYDMHDIICNVAISIASIENNRVLALKQEDVLKDWPNVETMKQCSWINLRVASNMVLPDAVECPQLTFLLLEGKDHSIKVPTEFFKEMKKLKVLDLTAMDLSSFPSSISLLSSLQTLCLKQCYLGDITVVGELKALEILSLSNSDIEKLPKEIGQLVQLKVLDLRGCTRLKAILAGLLSRLTKLEELYIGESFARYWEAEDDASQRSNASVNELSSLSHLTTLEVHIRDAKMVLGNFLFFQKLKRYKIFIGDVWKYLFGDYQYSRTLKLQFKTLSSIDHLHHGIKMLLEKIEDLHVDGLKGVKIALHEFIDEKGFPHLKNLHIQNCSGIQYIIPGGIAAKRNEFLINLRSLTLKDLPKLISFCFGDGRGSASKTQHQCLPLFGDKMAFPFLTRLIIERCDNLKYLISASTARSLVHLKYLEVVGCKSLIEIIYMEDTLKAEINEVEETLLFPQLDSLKMRNLQLLRGFCSENYNFDFKSLKILEIHECPHFMGFIYNSAMDPSSSQAPFNKLEVVFPCLTRLTIFRCDNLKYLLSASTATSLVHLNYLRVEGCKSLTEIISKEGNVEEMVLPCLTILIIKHCDNLKYLLSASTATSLVHLKYFHIARCEGLKEIISTDQGNVEDDHIMTQIFPKLESFELKHLKELERFCRAKNQFKLSSLSSLAFKDCPSFKTFVSDSIMEEAEENKSEIDDFSNPLFKGKVALPLLKDLRIKKLENLKRIWDDQLAAHSFCNLENLVVDWCENLLSTFPFNVSARMQKLKKLEIRHCNSVEEIIEAQGINARESNVETIPEFEFPQVTSLLLDSLPRLKSLYYKMHISKWPSLEAIKVNRCDRVKIFASEYDEKLKDRNGEGEERQHQIQPLFWTTKV
ncbi:Disease resistance protein [Corchorus olitorius]|uniref:Disease resistance protein n=1 Tax=Corchorus olitorius TaxID=93759 RepID=A0A1R3JWC0_9ROSI|nr:Disease resistance protein [Corchorus olitorius]